MCCGTCHHPDHFPTTSLGAPDTSSRRAARVSSPGISGVPGSYVNAAGDMVRPGSVDPFEGCDPDEDPGLWGDCS